MLELAVVTVYLAIPGVLLLALIYGFTGGFRYWRLKDWYYTQKKKEKKNG